MQSTQLISSLAEFQRTRVMKRVGIDTFSHVQRRNSKYKGMVFELDLAFGFQYVIRNQCRVQKLV